MCNNAYVMDILVEVINAVNLIVLGEEGEKLVKSWLFSPNNLTWLEASTVNGMPSSDFLQTTQVKQVGWYGFPVARRIRSRMGFSQTEHFSSVF